MPGETSSHPLKNATYHSISHIMIEEVWYRDGRLAAMGRETQYEPVYGGNAKGGEASAEYSLVEEEELYVLRGVGLTSGRPASLL